MKISAVVNTLNEESNIADCLESLNWVDEIVVVDMESDDKTKDIAYRYTKHVYNHKRVGYVEPARNFALSKTTGDWILVLDADERVPHPLAAKLIEIAEANQTNFVRIPRQNIIFNKWIEHSRWWPDHNIRFFKRNRVEWQNEIHSIPVTHGEGLTLDPKKELSITHFHYTSIDQYLTRLHRYTDIQSKALIEQGYKLDWPDLVTKPIAEFLSRFFAGQGYLDGLHGLALATLQAFSEFIVYLKVWQVQGFKTHAGQQFMDQFESLTNAKRKEFSFWMITTHLEHTQGWFKRLLLKIRRKLLFVN